MNVYAGIFCVVLLAFLGSCGGSHGTPDNPTTADVQRWQTEEDVPRLILAINSDDKEAGFQAEVALFEIGSPALPTAKYMLENVDDWLPRHSAAMAIGAIGDPKGIPVLIKAWKNEKDETVRAGVLLALADGFRERGEGYRPEIADVILEAMAHYNEIVRAVAVGRAAFMTDPQVDAALEKRREDTFEAVQRALAATLDYRAAAAAGDRQEPPSYRDKLRKAASGS